MEHILENTLENKAKFFALYWGQNIYNEQGHWNGEPVNANSMAILNVQMPFLLLTPLSSITDEDANHLDLNNYSSLNEDGVCLPFTEFRLFNTDEVDYLRSKGYALPYMGLSVEKLIEYGWIKLKN